MLVITRRALDWTVALVLPAVLLGAVELAARTGAVNPVFVPPPSRVFTTCLGLIADGRAVEAILHTLLLFFTGYGLGCLAGIMLGMLMGWSRSVYHLFEPIIELLRPIPKPALMPALMLFLGIGATMSITTIALASFFPVVIPTVQGAQGVDPTMINTARTFGHGRAAICWRIILPAAAPFILTGMRVSLGIGLVMVVMAEMVSGAGGLGDLILSSQRLMRVEESYAWLIILGVLGLALTAAFSWVERRVVFWHQPQVG